jgi:5'-3' exonuclease
MILLVDADSLVFASCHTADETKDKFFTDLKDAVSKFDEQFMKIVNDLDELFNVQQVITFNGSKGNFRKILNTKYKLNRKKYELPPLLHDMHQYVKDTYNSIYGFGIETDDLVAKYWHNLSKEVGRNNVMIVSLDKDYMQFPALIYNYHYNHKKVYDITEDEALYNFYEQCIVGDTADNVNFFKGKGKKFAEKYLKDCKTKYQYTKQLYKLFKEQYKGKARQKYIECYNLLKLRTI